jgi:hypothetical protein
MVILMDLKGSLKMESLSWKGGGFLFVVSLESFTLCDSHTRHLVPVIVRRKDRPSVPVNRETDSSIFKYCCDSSCEYTSHKRDPTLVI